MITMSCLGKSSFKESQGSFKGVWGLLVVVLKRRLSPERSMKAYMIGALLGPAWVYDDYDFCCVPRKVKLHRSVTTYTQAARASKGIPRTVHNVPFEQRCVLLLDHLRSANDGLGVRCGFVARTHTVQTVCVSTRGREVAGGASQV